jgi:hypothetical protein
VDTGLAVPICDARAIAAQTTRNGKLAKVVHGRQPILRRERNDTIALRI